ncbi:hypothetical protein J5N97_018492 [Dioscorea zingiberensis]|uniref:Saposin B-type domain-containing protein n=1 Tax=Dioscorea zingiberensis TaxID=325984 RepID=A0A9D5HBX1_9LILI|nr:hypothetical protein J5N97_018492 [Dioscorea zingiberensis]
MDPHMKQLRESLMDIETEAEHLLLARHQLVENDKLRNGNREALTALRKIARTTKSSIPSPFEALMKEIEGARKPLVKEICSTCGNHDANEHTWMMFPGSDIFASVPFHVAHTILEKDQERLDYDTKKLQSYVKEKSFSISEKGALADRISPVNDEEDTGCLLCYAGSLIANKMSIMEALSQDSICHSCLEVSRKAGKTLSDPKMFQGIGTLSNEVCHVLSFELQAKCLEVSNAYIHHSRLFLQELFHEKNLCNSTGICAEKSAYSNMNPMKLTDSRNCLQCRSSVKQILSKLKLYNMRMKIMEALLEYCEEAEDNEEQCKQAVYKYVPSVLTKLENMKPSDMCRMVGFCDEGISL